MICVWMYCSKGCGGVKENMQAFVNVPKLRKIPNGARSNGRGF